MKKLILLLIMIVCFASLVSAVDNYSFYDTFNRVDGAPGNLDFPDTVSWRNAVDGGAGGLCKITNQYLNCSGDGATGFKYQGNITEDQFTFKFCGDDSANWDVRTINDNDWTQEGAYIVRNAGTGKFFAYAPGAIEQEFVTDDNYDWYKIYITINDTANYITDAIIYGGDSCNTTTNLIANNRSIEYDFFSAIDGDDLAFKIANYDDVYMWNGSIGDEPSEFVDELNVNLISPVDEYIDNSLTQIFSYNYTGSITSADTCSLYTNETGSWIIEETQISPTVNVTNNISHIFSTDGDYLWSVSCNISNGTIYYADENRTLTIDRVDPSYSISFTNNSFYYLENITGDINISDNNLLYSLNVSIDNSITIFNITNINATSYNYTLNYNTSGLSAGTHYLNVKFADAHTAKKLKSKYKVKDGWFNQYLKFEYEEPYNEGWIKIQEYNDKSWWDEWKAIEQEDRYSFIYKPNKKKKEQVFEITSSFYLDIVDNPNTIYERWIVFDEHWLDFMPNTNVSFERVESNRIIAYVDNLDDKKDEIIFDSTGDLNVVELNYTFYNLNLTGNYLSSVIESEPQSINFTIEGNDANYTTTGIIYYGGVEKTTTKENDFYYTSFDTDEIDDPQENVTINFSFSINSQNFSALFNQTVYQISISDCSDPKWAKALTFVSKDEENNADLNNLTLNIDLEVWFETEAKFRNFAFGFDNAPNHSICLFPNETTYLVNAIMEYQNEEENGITYDNRKYYLDNYTLQQSNDTIYLYNIDDSKSSDVILKVYDKSTGQVVPGAFIKILRYYPGEGLYRTVEIEKTDTNGQTLGKMVLVDVFYKFIVEYQRDVVLNSEVEKILTTTKLLPIDLTENVLESFGKINSVSNSVTCTNSTKTCRFTWSDSQNIVQSAKFRVYRSNGYGQTLIHTNTTESVAGTMVYVITEETDGNSYLAEGIIDTTTEFSEYVMPFAWLVFKENINNWGGLSFLFPVMLLLIAVAFALIGIGAIGVIVGSLLVLVVATLASWLPLSIWSLMTFVILGGILIAKIKQ